MVDFGSGCAARDPFVLSRRESCRKTSSRIARTIAAPGPNRGAAELVSPKSPTPLPTEPAQLSTCDSEKRKPGPPLLLGALYILVHSRRHLAYIN